MSGRRGSLASILGPSIEVEPQAPPERPTAPVAQPVPAVVEPVVEAVPAAEPPARTERPAKATKPRERRTAPKQEGPMFATLEPKQARLRTDQRRALGDLAWRLERARPTGEGPRITDNTLIRVAIDLLLEHGDELSGATEEDMRESLRAVLR